MPGSAAVAQQQIRTLLAERIGEVAHELRADEDLFRAGVPSIDVVAVLAELELSARQAPEAPAELTEVGLTVGSLARYALAIGALA
jgi:hypothetical protein